MNFKFLAIIFYALFLTSCQPKLEFRDISDFETSDFVETNDKVELLYASGSPDNNPNLDYFIHLVAIHVESGDTINILTTFNRGGGSGDAKNIFKFYKKDSEEGQKFYEKAHQKSIEKNNKQNADKALSNINKVVKDKRFDHVAVNEFATVIGFIDK